MGKIKYIAYFFVIFFLAVSVLFPLSQKTFSVDCNTDVSINSLSQADLQTLISLCGQKVADLRSQVNTLSSQIQLMDTQIYLTEIKIQNTQSQIETTQKEIDLIDSRIGGLDSSLNILTRTLISRIIEDYKNHSVLNVSFFEVLFDSENANDFFTRLKYLQTAQENNQKLLVQVQEAKLNYEDQKKLREEKKKELADLVTTLNNQQVDLKNQQGAKKNLLVETQNSEVIYQNLLAQAKAEYAAIQGIIAGAGTETRLRDVSKGETIGSIISGPSCNSNGAHLHFTVEIGGSTVNPFNYLKPVDHTDDSGGDAWTPSGSWDWPVNPPIQFNQGYGITWFVNTYHWYPFHNGIDIDGTSYEVHSVADGTLYRGSYSGNGGCALPYAKVVHKDSNISTLYLHVYVQ